MKIRQFLNNLIQSEKNKTVSNEDKKEFFNNQKFSSNQPGKLLNTYP